MRICELKQVGTETVTNTVLVDDFDENGELVGQHEETVTREVPVMGTVYRDATPEELEQAERDAAEMAEWERTRPRTAEEQVAALLAKLDALMEFQGLTVRDLGGGVLEVVKAEMPDGDYTRPIKWVSGMAVELGKWYYADDPELPAECVQAGVAESYGAPWLEVVVV